MKCYLPRKLIRDSVPRVFIGGWSHRYPLPDTYPNSRLSERKQVLSINHVVYTNSLGTVSHSYRLMVGALPENKFPDARANLVSWPFQGQQSDLLCCSFLFKDFIYLFGGESKSKLFGISLIWKLIPSWGPPPS